MTSVKSRSTDYFPHRTMSPSIRQLQEALYTHLDDLEKKVFIEALSAYGTNRDVFELVNALRKVLNTPVKRELFPLVKRVIKHEDVEAFDLLTRDERQHSTLPRPFLYRPHIADLTVISKAKTVAGDHHHHHHQPTPSQAGTAKSASQKSAPVSKSRSAESIVSSSREHKHKTLSRRSSRSTLMGEVIEIDAGVPNDEDGGYGFTIRGGSDIGVGIYVSSVDDGSYAHVHGLTVGDLILEANNISFSDVTHDEAARIFKAATRLHLKVSRVGRVPGSLTVMETFTWTDPKGRPVSPPLPGSGLAAGEDDGRRKSGTLMLKGSDERKVNIVVQKGQGLGIMIRGGTEYGLGIFISGIDPFSVAENAGLKLGDQILDVNGRSFLDISHSEAVKHLKKRRHLIMTVRDVGKIPFSKTTIDETGWIQSTRVESYDRSVSSRRSASGSVTDIDTQKKSFLKGLGSQIMFNSPSVKGQFKGQLQQQVRLLLNESEQASLSYYLAEYDKSAVSVQGLVQALFELLNTVAKHDAKKILDSDVMSTGSYDSDDVIRGEIHKKTLFSHQKPATEVHQMTQGMESVNTLPDYQLNQESLQKRSSSSPNLIHLGHDAQTMSNKTMSRFRSRSKSPKTARNLTNFTRHLSPKSTWERQYKRDNSSIIGKPDDPSDDSGVEINGQIINGMTNGQISQTAMYQQMKQRHLLLQSNKRHGYAANDTYLIHFNKIADHMTVNEGTTEIQAPVFTTKSDDGIHFKKKSKDHFRVIEHKAEVYQKNEARTDQVELDHRKYSRKDKDIGMRQEAQSKNNNSGGGIDGNVHLNGPTTNVRRKTSSQSDPRFVTERSELRGAPSDRHNIQNESSVRNEEERAALKVDNRSGVANAAMKESSPASHSVRFKTTESYITINGNPGPPPHRHQTIIHNTYTPGSVPPPPPPSPPTSRRDNFRQNDFSGMDTEGRGNRDDQDARQSKKLSRWPRVLKSSDKPDHSNPSKTMNDYQPTNHEEPLFEELANQNKKKRIYSSPGKTGSKNLHPQNKHTTTISVPFIKINSENSPNVAASLNRQSASTERTLSTNNSIVVNGNHSVSSGGRNHSTTLQVNDRYVHNQYSTIF
ncbi:hypothetical protein Btru_058318 [Bulinus truncatus]|nr:hypothetical protein Btru_058318 [Bulinus truncatus]